MHVPQSGGLRTHTVGHGLGVSARQRTSKGASQESEDESGGSTDDDESISSSNNPAPLTLNALARHTKNKMGNGLEDEERLLIAPDFDKFDGGMILDESIHESSGDESS